MIDRLNSIMFTVSAAITLKDSLSLFFSVKDFRQQSPANAFVVSGDSVTCLCVAHSWILVKG